MSRTVAHGPNVPEPPPNISLGEWIDPNDGSVWIDAANNLVPRSRLERLRFEVQPDNQLAPIIGRIRAKKVPIPIVVARGGVEHDKKLTKFMYCKEDCLDRVTRPDAKKAFAEADRQLIEAGNRKGEWAISPRRVVEEFWPNEKPLLAIPIIKEYVDNGIPWMYGRGRLRKPTIVPMRYGHYGPEIDFWLEAEVAEFKKALAELRSQPIVRAGNGTGMQGAFIVVESDRLPNERIYRKEKWWITKELAARRIGCCPQSLIVWKNSGCLYLPKGNRPDMYEHKGKEYDGRPGVYFCEVQVWTIAERWYEANNPPDQEVIDGVLCYSVKKAKEFSKQTDYWLHYHVECKRLPGLGRAMFPLDRLESALKPLPSRPESNEDQELDLIFFEEACELFVLSHNTLVRLLDSKWNKNKGKLKKYLHRVPGEDGRNIQRPMLSKKELLAVFKTKPIAGKPIIVPLLIPEGAEIIEENKVKCAKFKDVNGQIQTRPLTEDGKYLAEAWYLRDDAKIHYSCSDQVLHKDGAIRTDAFYVIRDGKRRRPKRATVWSGWDLDDLAAGKAEREPRLCGTSLYARKKQAAYRAKIKEFLTELEQHLPILASDAHSLFKAAQFDGRKFSAGLVLEIKKKGSRIITKRIRGERNRCWWCLKTTTLPGTAQANVVSSANAEAFRKRKPQFFAVKHTDTIKVVGQLISSVPTTSPPAMAEWRVYPDLGIEVSESKRTVRNAKNEADFSGAPVLWHIFRVALRAYPDAVSVAQIKDGYPGVYAKSNRQVQTSNTNDKLKSVGVRILKRKLTKIGNISD